MKHIEKRPEPQEFIDWKAKGTKDWHPTFDNLHGSPSGVDDIVKESLIQDLNQAKAKR